MENTNTAPEATVINNHMVQAKPGNVSDCLYNTFGSDCIDFGISDFV